MFRRIFLLAGAAVVAAVLGCGLLAGCSATTVSDAPTTSVAGATTTAAPVRSDVPANVLATLRRIDAGTWPPDDGSGTKGGTPFGNREGRLPRTAHGTKVAYTEWDVNRKKRGQGRDAQRIITGNDGSAWYTLDHYETFTRIR